MLESYLSRGSTGTAQWFVEKCPPLLAYEYQLLVYLTNSLFYFVMLTVPKKIKVT